MTSAKEIGDSNRVVITLTWPADKWRGHLEWRLDVRFVIRLAHRLFSDGRGGVHVETFKDSMEDE